MKTMKAETVSRHPSSEQLVEFAAGSLHRAVAICVSAHLAYCDQCRSQVRKLDNTAAGLMAKQSAPVTEGLLDSLMARLDRVAQDAKSTAQVKPVADEFLRFPGVVRKLIASTPDSRWRRQSGSLSIARLRTGQQDYEVALQKISAGGKTPHHDHGGEEYVVVMKGSFSDEDGLYREGDFLVRKPGEAHQPMGAKHEECICLSVLSGPVKLSAPLGWLLKPWLRIRPM